MKKWNRALAILLAAGLAAGLCGCGNNAASPANPPAGYPTPVSQPVSETPVTPEPTPTAEPTPEPTPTPEPEPHGLVIVDQLASTENVTVYCVNPDTGKETVIADFSIPRSTENEVYAGGGSYSCPKYGFSDDYSKIICNKHFIETKEIHAGWVDSDGNFFNVTEALGLQSKSDFDDPVRYSAMGFYNGYFGYRLEVKGGIYTYGYVPLDNISPGAIQEGNLFTLTKPYTADDSLIAEKYGGRYKPWHVSDWIDDTRCIVSDVYDVYSGSGDMDSLIIDTAAQSEIKYIPGDSRDNWAGVANPDGTKIAFMSSVRNLNVSYHETDIYIVPIDGGDPVKVENIQLDLAKTCTLIDWI